MPPFLWRVRKRISPKRMAEYYKVMRRRASMYMFREQKKQLTTLAFSIGIEPKKMERYLDELWKTSLSRKQIGQQAMQELRQLKEWAGQQAAERRITNPAKIRLDFWEFMKNRTVSEALGMMRQEQAATGQSAAA